MKQPLVLAIDGGNWKTDLALVRSDGEVLALVRGPAVGDVPPVGPYVPKSFGGTVVGRIDERQ